MRIHCPQCQSQYNVDEKRIPPQGVQIKCPKCLNAFVVNAPTDAGAIPLPGGGGAVPLPGSSGGGAVPLPGSAGGGAVPLPGGGGARAVPLPGAGGGGAVPLPGAGGGGAVPLPGGFGGGGAVPLPGGFGGGAVPLPGAGGGGAVPLPGGFGGGAVPLPGGFGGGAVPLPGAGGGQDSAFPSGPVAPGMRSLAAERRAGPASVGSPLENSAVHPFHGDTQARAMPPKPAGASVGMDGGVLDFIDQAAGDAGPAPSRKVLTVRVRKRSGKVVGPIDESQVLKMLRGHELMGSEDASEDGVSWRPLSQFQAFATEIQALMASALSGLGDGMADLPAPLANGMQDLPAPLTGGGGGGAGMRSLFNDADLPAPFGNNDLPVPRQNQQPGNQDLPASLGDAVAMLDQPLEPKVTAKQKAAAAKKGGPFPVKLAAGVGGGLAFVALGLVTQFVTPDVGAFGWKKVMNLISPPPPPPKVEAPKAKVHVPVWNNENVETLLGEDNLASYQEAQKKLKGEMEKGNAGALLPLTRALVLPAYFDAVPKMADDADVLLAKLDPADAREGAALKAFVLLARGKAEDAVKAVQPVAGAEAAVITDMPEAKRRVECLVQSALGYALLAKDGKSDAAITRFDWALTAEPHNVVASLGQALALQARGDQDGAVGYMERTAQMEPENVRSRLMLGKAQLARHKLKPAKEALLVVAGAAGAKGSAGQRAEAHSLLSDIALQERDFKSASEELKAAVAEVPTDLSLKVKSGDMLLRLREWPQARQAFDDTLALNPNFEGAIVGSARAKIGATDALGGYKQLDDAVTKNPQSANLAYWFGFASEALGKTPEAVRLYKKSETLDPKRAAPVAAQARILVAERKYPAALTLLQAARGRVDPQEDAILRASLAEVMVKQRNHAGAFKEFEESLKALPGNSEARAAYGAALRDQGRFEEANKQLKQALLEDPRNATILAENGTYAQSQGQYEKAIDFFQQANAVAPKEPDYYVRLGSAYFQKGDTATALEHLKTAQSLAPNSPDVFYWMGLAVRKTDNEKAKSLFKQGMDLAPDEGRFDHELARSVSQEGAVLEAVDYLRSAVRKDPRNGDAYFEMGKNLQEQARYADARDQYQRAVEVMPHKAFIHMYIGDTYLRSGEYDKAKKEYEMAVKKDGTLSEAFCKLGDVMRTDQKLKPAVMYYEKCTQLNPKHKEAWKWLGYSLLGLGGKANLAKAGEAWSHHFKLSPDDPENEDMRDQLHDSKTR